MGVVEGGGEPVSQLLSNTSFLLMVAVPVVFLEASLLPLPDSAKMGVRRVGGVHDLKALL